MLILTNADGRYVKTLRVDLDPLLYISASTASGMKRPGNRLGPEHVSENIRALGDRRDECRRLPLDLFRVRRCTRREVRWR